MGNASELLQSAFDLKLIRADGTSQLELTLRYASRLDECRTGQLAICRTEPTTFLIAYGKSDTWPARHHSFSTFAVQLSILPRSELSVASPSRDNSSKTTQNVLTSNTPPRRVAARPTYKAAYYSPPWHARVAGASKSSDGSDRGVGDGIRHGAHLERVEEDEKPLDAGLGYIVGSLGMIHANNNGHGEVLAAEDRVGVKRQGASLPELGSQGAVVDDHRQGRDPPAIYRTVITSAAISCVLAVTASCTCVVVWLCGRLLHGPFRMRVAIRP